MIDDALGEDAAPPLKLREPVAEVLSSKLKDGAFKSPKHSQNRYLMNLPLH